MHPEMLHLQTELSKRRDKRLELASLRRDYEVASVTKRRKLDEDGVWSWWKVWLCPTTSMVTSSDPPSISDCCFWIGRPNATTFKPR